MSGRGWKMDMKLYITTVHGARTVDIRRKCYKICGINQSISQRNHDSPMFDLCVFDFREMTKSCLHRADCLQYERFLCIDWRAQWEYSKYEGHVDTTENRQWVLICVHSLTISKLYHMQPDVHKVPVHACSGINTCAHTQELCLSSIHAIQSYMTQVAYMH